MPIIEVNNHCRPIAKYLLLCFRLLLVTKTLCLCEIPWSAPPFEDKKTPFVALIWTITESNITKTNQYEKRPYNEEPTYGWPTIIPTMNCEEKYLCLKEPKVPVCYSFQLSTPICENLLLCKVNHQTKGLLLVCASAFLVFVYTLLCPYHVRTLCVPVNRELTVSQLLWQPKGLKRMKDLKISNPSFAWKVVFQCVPVSWRVLIYGYTSVWDSI